MEKYLKGSLQKNKEWHKNIIFDEKSCILQKTHFFHRKFILNFYYANKIQSSKNSSQKL